MWGGRSDRGERIGLIAARSGDVRMKFEGDLKWQSASNGQDLIYNDAIYAGAGSNAKLRLGDSEMTVTENTLVVLRRQKDVNFLNLNYGTILSKVGKNEKVVIDTGDGKPLELTTKNNAQVILRKVGGKTEFNVVSGNAEVMINGKKTEISKDKPLVIEEPKKVAKPEPKVELPKLQALTPLKDRVIVSEQPTSIDFEWTWKPAHKPAPEDQYTLEFSNSPGFEQIHATKQVKGQLTAAMAVSRSLSLFYRVRGPHGELSQTEKVNFVRLEKPFIVTPLANQKILTPPGQNAFVPIEFKRPENSTVWYQVATDPDFNEMLVNQTTAQYKVQAELAIGNYFLRARSLFAENKMSSWTNVVPFKVEPKLDKMNLASIPDKRRILIPNREYPASLYNASPVKVRNYLAGKGFLNDFFPFKKGSFDELKVEVKGQKETFTQVTPAWPAKVLVPGDYKYRYQVSKLGAEPQPPSNQKQVTIAMEPPRPIGEAQLSNPAKDWSREATWSYTPLLFAKSYDVELSRDPAFATGETMKATGTSVKQKLQPGDHYWRVRARDAKGNVISDYSDAKRINVPQPAANTLAQNERKPQAVEKTVTRVEKEKENQYQPNGWWAWAGGGANFVDYKQSVQGRSSFSSTNVKGPSQYMEVGFDGSSGWGGVFTYKNTPGEILVNNAVIDNGAYAWTTISIEGLKRRQSPFTLLGSPIIYGLRIGIQQHKTPFVFVNSDGDVNMKTNEMNTGSMGVLAELQRRRWTYYWLMRYQFPFSSKASGSDNFSITPVFAFDGSIGASYDITKRFKVGTFWYGQWHQYNFVYGDGTVTNEGFQSLFYSNIDLRLGYDF